MSMLIARRSDRFTTPLGCRAVHWFHNPKQYDRPRDQFEWDMRPPKEFGESRITDHDRMPHYYFELTKGRGFMSQPYDIKHWKFNKDWYANLGRDKLARMRRFKKIDTFDFLEKMDERYIWLPNDADGAIGYISDEDDDPITDAPEFGLSYLEATPDYRDRVLKDRCQGRPVFEWQIPFGTHIIHGYKEVLTAVDVVGNEDAVDNLSFRWTDAQLPKGSGIQLEDKNENKKLVICNLDEAPDVIKSFEPDTVILPYAADKPLSTIHSTYSGKSRNDQYGCAVLAMWSVLWYCSPFYPLGFTGVATSGILAGANAFCCMQTYRHPDDVAIKKTMEAIRGAEIETVILGDWLDEDYNERVFHTSVNDRAVKERSTSATRDIQLAEKTRERLRFDENKTPAGKAYAYLMSGAPLTQYLGRNLAHLVPSFEAPAKTNLATVMGPDFPVTYRDAINLKRADVIAHVTNNSPGEKLLLCVRDIDNMPSEVVQEVLRKKLQTHSKEVGAAGQTHLSAHNVTKIPLVFDEAYESVEVVF